MNGKTSINFVLPVEKQNTTVREIFNRIVLLMKIPKDIGNGVDANFPENAATEFDLTCNEYSRVRLRETGLNHHQGRHTQRSLYTRWLKSK